MTASPAIQVYNPNAGNALPLLPDTSKGDTTVTLSPPDAATLTPGDYVLLHSKKPVDAEEIFPIITNALFPAPSVGFDFPRVVRGAVRQHLLGPAALFTDYQFAGCSGRRLSPSSAMRSSIATFLPSM